MITSASRGHGTHRLPSAAEVFVAPLRRATNLEDGRHCCHPVLGDLRLKQERFRKAHSQAIRLIRPFSTPRPSKRSPKSLSGYPLARAR